MSVLRSGPESHEELARLPTAVLEAGNAEDQREIRRRRLRMGMRLRILRERRAHLSRGSSSPRHEAERNGCGAAEAKQLLQIAEAAAVDPRVGPAVLSGEIPAKSAAALSRVLLPEGCPVPDSGTAGVDWVELAKATPTERFCDMVSGEVARRGHDTLVRLVAWVSDDGRRFVRRAHNLLRRSEGRDFSVGETLRLLAREYLLRKDPRFAGVERARRERKDRGEERPSTRHIPAAVADAVTDRDGDQCAVPLCPDEVWLDFAHLYVPHAEGGKRSVENLGRMCHAHNQMQERGLLKVVRHPTGPVFVDAQGFVIERVRSPSAPRRTLEQFLADMGGAPPRAPPGREPTRGRGRRAGRIPGRKAWRPPNRSSTS